MLPMHWLHSSGASGMRFQKDLAKREKCVLGYVLGINGVNATIDVGGAKTPKPKAKAKKTTTEAATS